MIRTWSFVAYLALAHKTSLWLSERLWQIVKPHPAPPLVQFRKYDLVRTRLTLEQPYHPAKSRQGYVLIPKDHYFKEAEEVLERL